MRRWNILQRELEQKTRGMLRYQDLKIGEAMEAAATGNVVDATAAQWTTAENVRPDISEAIRLCREDNYEPDTLVLSPRAYELLLNSISVTEEWTAGVVREGRLLSYLGLSVVPSNNLPTEDNVFVFKKNAFGFLAQAIPLSTDTEYIKSLLAWRIYIWAMDAPVVDVPDAIAVIKNVY